MSQEVDRNCRANEYLYLWITNSGAAEITLNSIVSLQRSSSVSPSTQFVAVLDDQAIAKIKRSGVGVNVIDLSKIDGWSRLSLTCPKTYKPYNSPEFRTVAVARYFAIEHLLKSMEKPVVYADGDVVFLRDPSNHFDSLQTRGEELILVQNDRRGDIFANEWSIQYRPKSKPQSSEICSGFSVWYPVETHALVARQIAKLMVDKRPLPSDQDTFNLHSDKDGWPYVLLRQDLFPNGSLYFRNSYYSYLPDDMPNFNWKNSYIVHANWMIGIETKKRALKDAGLWFIEVD